MKHTALPPVTHLLSPRDAAWLAGTIARNQARFAGWSMEQTDPEPKDGDDPRPEPKDPEPKPGPKDAGGDKPLGENGEKALKAERDARKALEGELSDLKKNLAAAFGVKAEAGIDDDKDTLSSIQQQIADMKHENTVLALANEHRITQKDDLDLLRATRDPDALAKLATRLAPAGDDAGDQKRRPGTPRPDTSQGRGGDNDAKASVATGRDLYAARRGKKTV